MEIPIYQVDAFADAIFEGNPAAVCPLSNWLPDEILQSIAQENNLSETAFFCVNDNPLYIRWFTPVREVELCGHATLASAHVLKKHLGRQEKVIQFDSLSGLLAVIIEEDRYTLDFPADQIRKLDLNHPVTKFFSIPPEKVYRGKTDFLLVYSNRKQLEKLSVDFDGLSKYEGRGVIVTAPDDEVDFVSRGFFPQCAVNEDPVTGSAHTTLAVFWAKELGKSKFAARQISKRGGNLDVKLMGDRVFITGKAITFLQGKITF